MLPLLFSLLGLGHRRFSPLPFPHFFSPFSNSSISFLSSTIEKQTWSSTGSFLSKSPQFCKKSAFFSIFSSNNFVKSDSCITFAMRLSDKPTACTSDAWFANHLNAFSLPFPRFFHFSPFFLPKNLHTPTKSTTFASDFISNKRG